VSVFTASIAEAQNHLFYCAVSANVIDLYTYSLDGSSIPGSEAGTAGGSDAGGTGTNPDGGGAGSGDGGLGLGGGPDGGIANGAAHGPTSSSGGCHCKTARGGGGRGREDGSLALVAAGVFAFFARTQRRRRTK
jgi:hypothetical protein